MKLADLMELIKSIRNSGQDAHIVFRKGQYVGTLYGVLKEEEAEKK